MAVRKKRKLNIAPLIVELRGNVAAVARKLKVTRKTIYEHINADPELQALLEDSREAMLDDAENTLYEEALKGNTTALIFFLKTKGRKRGYTEHHSVEHSGSVTWAQFIADHDEQE